MRDMSTIIKNEMLAVDDQQSKQHELDQRKLVDQRLLLKLIQDGKDPNRKRKRWFNLK
jgi:hypothetical protein